MNVLSIATRSWSIALLTGASLFTAHGCAPAGHQTRPQPKSPVLEVAFETSLTTNSDPDRPHSQVTLLWSSTEGKSERVPLDQVTGECGPPSAQAPREAIEVLYLQCWWAGQGMDYRLVQRGDNLVVERQYQAEEIGLEDEEPFEPIYQLPLAPGIRVRPGSP
ncbi:MAG: hypothetical protein VX938_04590 [Myxococcota bacterium]|nr:hypothetical protein [Myxococcota bacterium]